jgi:heme oxygenase (mycobilin-producing)
MLIRVVRMTFQADKVGQFLEIFEQSKHKIRAFDGCEHLELWRDAHLPNVFCTYSHWQSEAQLNNYRDSALFAQVWPATKALFADKPIAFSSEIAMNVNKT